ncbi:signalosome component [Fusarium oxysporum]|nr:signalosome component [Fusarium oxysporum]
MSPAQLRSAGRLAQLAGHVNGARQFSTRPALRKEIQDAYILSAARTPTAKFNGSFLSVSAPKLGAVAIKSALEKSKVPVEKITDVYMGNVLQGSVGQAPARQAAIFAGLPKEIEATTINKVCASGLKAVALAAQNIQLGLSEAQIAGGMENMSQVPYYVPRASGLPAFGHVKMEDGLIKDGLTDVYDQFHMGNCAENTVKNYKITREQQDEYAIQSYRNAQKAWADKAFADEIAPVTVKSRKGETVIDTDEGFNEVKFDKIPTLKPAFVRDGSGTVTAANSSTLNDGASALVLGSKAIAQQYGSGSRVLAKICGYADAATSPIDFPIAPAKAVPIALERAGITKDQVAIWEFNEAFASVILANSKILGLEGAKVNPLGGAISLGHALGSSGSRILTTLLHQLKPGEYGVAAICNGGGAATALVVQRVDSTSPLNSLFTLSLSLLSPQSPPSLAMPLVLDFLTQIRNFIRTQNGDELRAWLQVEPNSPQQYHNLASELRSQFRQQGLDNIVERTLPQEDDVPEGQATVWPGFVAFMKDYMAFWRDVNYDDLLGAHQLLSGLVNSCATAFAHPTYGAMLLKTSMSLSETLARLTMSLNKRPDLARRLRAVDEDKSIAESSAEIIQKIFTTCLTDRSSGRYAKPEGKKVGVYMFANLVLKLLFACRRTHLAKMIFVNISTISPPLSLYPAAQRVTFLYYLGRFNFSNNHYLRAALCLEEAYLQTPSQLVSHRTNILTYLIPCNILLGRFPSQVLLQRPECQTLAPVFFPICQAIRSGNFIQFQHHLAQHETWLFEKGLLLTLAATLDLADLHTLGVYLQHRLEGWLPAGPNSLGRSQSVNPLLMKALENNAQNPEATSTLAPPPGGPKSLRPNEGMIWGNAEVTFEDVEMTVATLVQQGLMHGFIAHGQGRFAIIGAKAKGSPVLAGWPNVWQINRERRYEDYDPDEVPGWVKE